MAVELSEAIEAAEAWLNREVGQSSRLVIVRATVQSYDFGWVLFYDSEELLQTARHGDALAGNAPLICEKHTGRFFVTGTAKPLEEYLERYVAAGDPHAELQLRVRITACT